MAEVNRNDPCPCGSGKKYKKCCMGEDLERKHRHRKHGGFGFNPAAYEPTRGREILKNARIKGMKSSDLKINNKLASTAADSDNAVKEQPATEEAEKKNTESAE